MTSSRVALIRGHDESPIGAMADLAALECMHDAKIVCADGAIWWNSILLSQWSKVVRNLLMDGSPALAAHPLTLLAPDVEVSTMERLLSWSVRGEVALGRREAVQVKAALLAFGPRVQFTQQLLPPSAVARMPPGLRQHRGVNVAKVLTIDSNTPLRSNIISNNISNNNNVSKASLLKKPNKRMAPSVEPGASSEKVRRIQGTPLRKSKDGRITVREGRGVSLPNISLIPLDKGSSKQKAATPDVNTFKKPLPTEKKHARVSMEKIPSLGVISKVESLKDLLKKRSSAMGPKGKPTNWSCILCSTTGKTGFKGYLSHLARKHYFEQLEKIWGGALDEPCRFCHRVLINDCNRKQPRIQQRYILADHLANAHGKVFSLADERVRSALKATTARTTRHPLWGSCVRFFADLHRDCEACGNMSETAKSLTYHLSMVHHWRQLTALFGGEKDRCDLCRAEVKLNFGGATFSVVRHLTSAHPEALYGLLPPEGADLLRRCSSAAAADDDDDVSIVSGVVPAKTKNAAAGKRDALVKDVFHAAAAAATAGEEKKKRAKTVVKTDGAMTMEEELAGTRFESVFL